MTPMIDMTFLLLIFFMVSASFSLQKSIPIPAPDAESAASQSRTIEEIEQDDDFIIVRIDRDDTVWVNDSEAPSRHELLAKLRNIREESPKGPSTLMVMANGDCRHETVVMVLDAGTAVGMQNVRLASAGDDDF
jgi:biopolymer transport protein ExbD